MVKISRFSLPVFVLAILVCAIVVEGKCLVDKKQSCDYKPGESRPWNTSVRFFLYTQRNRKSAEMLHMCNGTLPRDTHFNPNHQLIVFIPGFYFGLCEIPVIEEIKDELLEKGDYNVILIDNKNEYGADYAKAATKNVQKVAHDIVDALKNIQAQTGIDNSKIYLVGHSLGAQAAGYVGSVFKVNRITGLDPAGPSFEKEIPNDRKLDAGDADLVDILHCNGGTGLPYLGIAYAVGDADFYINGGVEQPSCYRLAWEFLKGYNVVVAMGVTTAPTACAHMQCLEFYKLSINRKHGNLHAWHCQNLKSYRDGNCFKNDTKSVQMGFDFGDAFISDGSTRKYYIDTTETWPYVSKNVTIT